jgi:type IV pilus assembly protein PilQ
VADERTNTLMISDIPKKIARMRELINVIDRPVDQVLIESRIVIATDTFASWAPSSASVAAATTRTSAAIWNQRTRKSQVEANATNAKAYRDWLAGGSTGPAPVPVGSAITRGLN